MSRNAQTSFQEALEKLINYHVDEFKVTISEIIGVLEITKLNFYASQPNSNESEDDDQPTAN